MHALHCVALSNGGRGQKGGLSEYAERVGRHKDTISAARMAAEVFEKLSERSDGLHDKTAHLTAIHALPEACWQPAVEAMLKGGCSAKETGARKPQKKAPRHVAMTGRAEVEAGKIKPPR